MDAKTQTWYTYRNVGEIKDIDVYDFQILFIVRRKIIPMALNKNGNIQATSRCLLNLLFLV